MRIDKRNRNINFAPILVVIMISWIHCYSCFGYTQDEIDCILSPNLPKCHEMALDTFTFSPASPQRSLPVAFTCAAHSTRPGGWIVSYAMDFGDGTSSEASDIGYFTHSYDVVGTFVARCILTDDFGVVAWEQRGLAVTENVSRFTKLGANGEVLPDDATWDTGLRMVKDNQMDLFWAMQFGYGNRTDADLFAHDLSVSIYGGYGDWRLPTTDEIMSSWKAYVSCDRLLYWVADSEDFFYPWCGRSFSQNEIDCVANPGSGCQLKISVVRSGPQQQNHPPSSPTLIFPQDSAVDINPNNVTLEWSACTDPEGDLVEYFVFIREFGPNSPVVVQSYTATNSYSITLEPNKIYEWTVWAKDTFENYSDPSSDWVFTTKIDDNNPLAAYNGLGFDVDFFSYESIYSIILNCIQYDDYTYKKYGFDNMVFLPWMPGGIFHPVLRLNIDKNYCDKVKNLASYDNHPIQVFPSIDGAQRIAPILDAAWGNDINGDSHFNTVYSPPTIGDKFEIISEVDEMGPICTTSNLQCYYFTYDSKDDATGCITIDSWLAYLSAIKSTYQRRIDILTIYAHGSKGKITMSDKFTIDISQLEKLKALRNILSSNATILLFSCEVGQDEQFIQALANATLATVYANSNKTGNTIFKGGAYVQDWTLDVIKRPPIGVGVLRLLLE